ncbi:TIGR03857 family LLM class F420-dependent oxidoreductase [Pseudonocardia sp. NPDC049154]|uniref:TIGR03857 family LLM class F420-dependent oxidoreductase n=1 Tax=Pseudonocardia sp. NPDC049154 TaxID=3155501 RepID=UPI0033C6F602
MQGSTVSHPELGCYLLAGAPESPRDLIDQVAEAERLGLGSAFLSERWNIKEAASLSGAAGAVSSSLQIVTAATNSNTRHPLVTASFATTMHRLTGGRFTLGLGRGAKVMYDMFGLPAITTAELEDFAGLMRRLWRGEAIVGHSGPAGDYRLLALDSSFDEDIPLGLVAFGPRTLDLAGRVFDTVVLHTFFTDETTRRCVDTVKSAAERVGRDPDAVKVWACLATVGDHLSEVEQRRKMVGRLATYLQMYGDLMVHTNDWDPAVLRRFREDSLVAGFRGLLDGAASDEELAHVAELLPDEWLAPSATGTPAECAAAVRAQFDLGVDGVILHGATPHQLGPVVKEYATTPPSAIAQAAEASKREIP